EHHGVFSEATSVKMFYREAAPIPVTLAGNTFVGSTIGVMNSHSDVDALRNTHDQPLYLYNNVFNITFADEGGAPDQRAAVLLFNRGVVDMAGNVFRVDASAVTDQAVPDGGGT